MVVSPVRVPMVMVTRRKHADEVHRQPDGTDDEQLGSVHLWWVEQSLDRLKNDKDRDQTEEQPISETRERLDAGVAAR